MQRLSDSLTTHKLLSMYNFMLKISRSILVALTTQSLAIVRKRGVWLIYEVNCDHFDKALDFVQGQED